VVAVQKCNMSDVGMLPFSLSKHGLTLLGVWITYLIVYVLIDDNDE
jgi:hypothetical protein